MRTIRNSPSGPDFIRGSVLESIDHGSITTKEVLEAAGTFAGLQQTDGLFVAPTSTYSSANVFFSHARRSGADAISYGVANMAGVGVDPDPEFMQGSAFFRTARYGPSGAVIGNAGSFSVDPGNITTIETLAVDSGVTAVSVSPAGSPVDMPVIVSPREALPAGLALSHAFVDTGTIRVVLANLTGGDINPGAIQFDFFSFPGAALPAVGVPVRAAPSGPPMCRVFNDVTIDHDSVASAAVLEAAVTLTGARVGDVVFAAPRAALTTGIALSHGRVSAPNTVQVGLGNLTGAPVNPAAVTYDIAVFGTGA